LRAGRVLLLVRNDADFFLLHNLPLARAAQAAGYRVHVTSPPAKSVSRIVDEGFTHHATPLRRCATSPLEELRYFGTLLRLYRKLRPDVVHHVTVKPVIYGGLAARLTGIPAVVHAITGLGYVFIASSLKSKTLRMPVNVLYRLALGHPHARTIFQNPDDLESFVNLGLVRRGAAVLIRSSGVDMTRYVPIPEPAATPVVLFPGRMLWDKGLLEFVASAKMLRSRGVVARFVLVGDVDPNPTSASVAQIKEWEANGLVEWWGPSDDMPAVYKQASIVCLPSYREGLPKVLVEAAACGRALVSTDVPGCREVVRNGENGWLVPPRDAEALAEHIGMLLANPGLRARMGRRGRELVAEDFAVEKVVKEILAIYEELLS